MLNICHSKARIDADLKKEPKAAKVKGAGKVNITDEMIEKYTEPVNSAKTKFDHCDVFFAKDGGMNGYCEMIAKETLTDIKIDESDKTAMKEHYQIVVYLIKDNFVNFKRNEAKMKN